MPENPSNNFDFEYNPGESLIQNVINFERAYGEVFHSLNVIPINIEKGEVRIAFNLTEGDTEEAKKELLDFLNCFKISKFKNHLSFTRIELITNSQLKSMGREIEEGISPTYNPLLTLKNPPDLEEFNRILEKYKGNMVLVFATLSDGDSPSPTNN